MYVATQCTYDVIETSLGRKLLDMSSRERRRVYVYVCKAFDVKKTLNTRIAGVRAYRHNRNVSTSNA